MFEYRGADIEAVWRAIVFARGKKFPYFFNCEEAALVTSTCIKGHVLTILLLSMAVAMAAITATSPSWHPRKAILNHETRKTLTAN